MKFVRKPGLIALALMFWTNSSVGQITTPPKKEIELAVVKVAELVRSNYVFENQGNQIANRLIEEFKKGRFNSIGNWDDFASLSTSVLQELSSDGHLFVRHDRQTVKELLAPAEQVNNPAEDPFFHNNEARERNYGFQEVKVLQGNIGYIKLSEINLSEKSLPTMFAAVEFVSNTKALILDLRDNGGGGSEVGPVLESIFLPKNVALLEFKSRGGQVTKSETVSWITRQRYLNPLFIVINKKTASAAEALAFGLQAKKRATVVGQRSAGAANMNSWYVVNDAVFVSVSTGAPTLPGTTRSWERNGIEPDHVVAVGDELDYVLRRIKAEPKK